METLSNYLLKLGDSNKLVVELYGVIKQSIESTVQDTFQGRWDMKGTSSFIWASLHQYGGAAASSSENKQQRIDLKKINDSIQESKLMKSDIVKLGGALRMNAQVPLNELFQSLLKNSPEKPNSTTEETQTGNPVNLISV